MTLSLAMIVRNEQETIARVLDDVASICDEMIVLDTGSTDNTIAIAEEHHAKVFTFEWIDDFSSARNTSFSYCNGDWILWLDADDRVSPESAQAIRNIHDEVVNRIDIDTVLIPYYYTFTDTQPEQPLTVLLRERLIRRLSGLRWKNEIHESISIDPKRSIEIDNAVIEHRPLPEAFEAKRDRNLGIALNAMSRGARGERTVMTVAKELMLQGDFEEAKKYFEQSIRILRNSASQYDALIGLATCFESLGEFEQCVATFVEAVMFDSRRAEGYVELGRIFSIRKEWAKALTWFAAAAGIKSSPDISVVYRPIYTWLPWDFMATCCFALQRYDEAYEFIRHVVNDHPEQVRVEMVINRILDATSNGFDSNMHRFGSEITSGLR